MTPNDDDRRAAVALFDDTRTRLGLQNKLMDRDTVAVAYEAIIAAERRGIERAAAEAGQLLRDPRPSDALFAEACKLVQAGDYRLAWFKMCEALPKRYEEGFAAGERRGIERAAAIADAHDGKPMGHASGWTDEQAAWYDVGQMDCSSSIAAAIRAITTEEA